MIALDTSSLVAFLQGDSGSDVVAVRLALEQKQIVLPPIVLSEILSDSKLSSSVIKIISDLPLLEIEEGFWQRSGFLRSRALGKGYKSRLADSLIAQICIDHHLPLITRDKDFRHFTKYGLKLIP